LEEYTTELTNAPEEKEILKTARRHFTKFGLVFLVGSAAYMGLQYVGAILGVLYFPQYVSDMNGMMIAQMLPAYVIAVPLFLLLLRLVPETKPQRKKLKTSTLISLFPMIYAVTILSNLVGVAFNSLLSDLTQYEATNLVEELLEETSPSLVFFLTVIMAPLVEELLFRKALINRTMKYGEGVAVLLSGVMFGLIHGNLYQIPYAFSIGCVLGYVYLRSGNLGITIALHAFTNLMGGVIAQSATNAIDLNQLQLLVEGGNEELLMQFMIENAGGVLYFVIYMVLVVVLVISGSIIFILQARKVTLNPAPEALPKGKRFRTVILNPGMLLFLATGIGFIFLQS